MMDNLDDFTTTTKNTTTSFFNHVFNFDQKTKTDVLNLLQYTLFILVPIILLNKLMQKYIPEADDTKTSIELSLEVVSQLTIMVLGLYLINKMVTFFSTYSGTKYADINIIQIVPVLLIITLSLQTKLGEKVSILSDRVIDLWEGKTPITQSLRDYYPIPQQSQTLPQIPIPHQMPQLPPPIKTQPSQPIQEQPTQNTTQPQPPIMSPEQLPDYNNMYQNTTTPLVNAATPGVSDDIVAANDAFGVFGTNF